MSSLRKRSFASARVTGATGVMTRTRGVLSCYREGVGIYHLIFPAARSMRSGEYDFTFTAENAAAREVVAGNGGGVAPPVGANAPAGTLSLKVLAFDAAGLAADTDFAFEAQRS